MKKLRQETVQENSGWLHLNYLNKKWLRANHLIETKYKGMRSKPRLKEKQGKEVRTSKIYAEKHRYPRLDTEIQIHRERDTGTGWDTRHLLGGRAQLLWAKNFQPEGMLQK